MLVPRIGRTHIICLLLASITLVLYWPALDFDFVCLDDGAFITSNNIVQGGITRHGFLWALKAAYAGNWHPLTWLSYMVDSQFFGAKPWGYHLTNVLIHTANAVLLFLVLQRLTGAGVVGRGSVEAWERGSVTGSSVFSNQCSVFSAQGCAATPAG